MPLLRVWAIAVCVCLVCGCPKQQISAPEPVSYGRVVAPIFAMHCNGCHGGTAPSSGFRTSTYVDLVAGGVLGDDIVPGSPERSMAVQFIEGFRGPDQRMPLGAQPLTVGEIGSIRRWIAEGASNDHAATPCYRLEVEGRAIGAGKPIVVSGEVSKPADLVLLIEAHDGRVLDWKEASVKKPAEQMDAGEPRRPLNWTIHWKENWPQRVDVELRVRYASAPVEARLSVRDGGGATATTRAAAAAQCTPE